MFVCDLAVTKYYDIIPKGTSTAQSMKIVRAPVEACTSLQLVAGTMQPYASSEAEKYTYSYDS